MLGFIVRTGFRKRKGGEFEELWIGWLPEELKGEAEHTRSEQTEDLKRSIS